MGAAGEDLQLSAAARQALPFSFEAKNQERVSLWSAIKQARANTPVGAESVVVFKKNQQNPHVVITWDCFKTLVGPRRNSMSSDDWDTMRRVSTDLTRIIDNSDVRPREGTPALIA